MATTSFDVAKRLMSREMLVRTRKYVTSEDTTPMHVDLDLTSDCNYRCRHCGDLARNLLNRGGLSWDLIEPLLDDLQALRVHEVALIGGGEPTLSPHCVDTLHGLHAREIHTGVVSNGSRLTDTMLDAMDASCDWVRVSLDAGTADIYARVHKPESGVSFEHILATLKRMIERIGRRVGISYLITPLNMHEIALAAQVTKSIGAAYIRIRPMQHPITGAPVSLPSRSDVMMELRRAAAFADDTFEVSLGEMTEPVATRTNAMQPKPYHVCHAQAFGATIAGDGKVYVCSKWRGEAWACIGDLRRERLWAIWHGSQRKEVIATLTPSVKCQHVYCHAHPLNMLLHDAIGIDRSSEGVV